MKIAIICRPRTSSTALIESLQKEFDMTNYGEDYLNTIKNLPTYSNFYTFFQRRNNLPESGHNFQQDIKTITNKIWNTENFVIKIFPRMLTIPPYRILESEVIANLQKKVLFNISDTMNFHLYDRIYILDRDIYSSSASWIYSNRTYSFFPSERDLLKEKKIKLTEKDYNQLRFTVLEYVLFCKLTNYLIEKEIPFTNITNSLNDYINQKNTQRKKSNRIFSELIEDYTDMCLYIDDYHKKCVEETKDWFFY